MFGIVKLTLPLHFKQRKAMIKSQPISICQTEYEPRREKTAFLYMRKQRRRSTLHHEADQRLCFRYTESTIPLHFLNPKFQGPSHLLWLYSPVCVGPGRKPRRPVFSQRGSYIIRAAKCLIEAVFNCISNTNNSSQTKHMFKTAIKLKIKYPKLFSYEPRHEKTGLRGFLPGLTQTRLYSH